MSRPRAASKIDPDETYPLQPLESLNPKPRNKSRSGETNSWRPGVKISLISLVIHAVLGLGLCAVALYFTFSPDYADRGWFSLYSFGRPLPLLTARYFNFGLDISARVLSLTLEILLAFVALRTATTLWSLSRGVRVSDALTFNFVQLEIFSILMTTQTKTTWRTKISYAFSIICGIIVALSGSLVFGYENVTIQKSGNENIQMGGNQMLLGSNISGLYSAPDYSSLAPSNGSVPPFTTTVLRTLLDIDLSQSNESISSFDLSSESHASLLSRNISSALISEIVSTQLKDCQPVSIPPSPSFGFLIENNFITYAEQNLSSTSGGISQLREELFANPSLFTTSKYQTYTFLMTHAASTNPSPADDSQVMILLAYKAAQCASGPFKTPFGPMPHGLVNTSVTYLVNSSFPHNHAALACRNVRTITRTVYAPDGNHVEQTSQSFYAKPVLSTLNRLYLYFPVMSTDTLTESLLIAKYGGIGALLNKDLIYTTGWRLPGCTYGTATSGNSTADLDAISAAWGKAVARLQHYETTVLQAFVKQNTSFVSTPVLIATPAYRLALMPGALFIYGLAMTITACLLIVLLALGDHNRRSLSVKSLSLWRVADKLGTVRDSEPEDVQAEKSERSLRRDLGMVRIRRRARAAV